MRRGTIFIFLFIVAAAIIVGAGQFLRAQPAMEVIVAVDPLAQAWAQEVVDALNATQPTVSATRRVLFKLSATDDLDVWAGSGRTWTASSHPDAWLAGSALSVQYAQENGVPLTNLTPSLARTPLLWGGYASRVTVVTQNGAQPLDWSTVQTLAKAERWDAIGGSTDWQFVKLAFAQPNRKIGGVAALLSGAASFYQTPTLEARSLSQSDFHDWLLPVVNSVPNFTTLGSDPAAAMARGPSTVEIALFPEAQWLLNLRGLLNIEEVRLNYPVHQFVLDFPLAAWQDSTDPDATDVGEAIKLLADALAAPMAQNKLTAYGLRPAASEPTEADALFAAAVPYGVLLTPDYGQVVQIPSRSDTQGLIQWFGSNQ